MLLSVIVFFSIATLVSSLVYNTGSISERASLSSDRGSGTVALGVRKRFTRLYIRTTIFVCNEEPERKVG